MKTEQIIENSIICPDGTYLRSYHQHDYKMHIDTLTGETYMVDGGCSYLRRSINKVPATDASVFMGNSFSIIRKAFVWKSYGKNAEHAPEGIYTALIDLGTDHIRAILDTQVQMRGTYVEALLNQELFVRNLTKASNLTKGLI